MRGLARVRTSRRPGRDPPLTKDTDDYILSIIALVQSKNAGQKNGLAIAGIIISVVWPIIITILATTVLAPVFANLFSQCAALGPGVHEVGGVTYTCS